MEYYGLTKKEFYKRLELEDLFIVCDIQGVEKYKKLFPDAIALFIYTNFGNIQKQLIERGGTHEEIEERISLYNEEMKGHEYADMVVVNKYGQMSVSIQNFKNIIKETKKSRVK
jgi:guanylate kinase